MAGDGAGIDVLADMVRRLQEGTGGGGMEGQRHEGGCASCAERDGWRTMGQSSAYLALPNTCIRMQIRPPHTLTHSPTLLPRSPHYSPPDTRGLCLLLGYFFVPELCSVLKNPTPRTSPHLRSVLLARLLFGPGAAQRPDAHDECHGQHTQSGRHQAHLSGVRTSVGTTAKGVDIASPAQLASLRQGSRLDKR